MTNTNSGEEREITVTVSIRVPAGRTVTRMAAHFGHHIDNLTIVVEQGSVLWLPGGLFILYEEEWELAPGTGFRDQVTNTPVVTESLVIFRYTTGAGAHGKGGRDAAE